MAYDNHSIPRPTYFKTNEFSHPFQLIVDTYGVPTYLEANPALIGMVTFPFFFGMMFGDMGHGSVILCFGTYLCLAAESLRHGVMKGFVQMRYLFLMMGIMSVFCGFIYNEFFAMNTHIFSSCYEEQGQVMWNATKTDAGVVGDWVYPRKTVNCNYPAGQDPVWGLTNNKLTFVNGVKMKMSVIFGILHMTMGLIIKGLNSIYFRQYVVLVTEVIAGAIILLFLFGWMDVLIIAKWYKYLDVFDTTAAPEKIYFESESENGDNYISMFNGDYQNQHMPSVINIMINTVFNGGKHDATETPIITSNIDTEYNIAMVLLVIAIAFIPIMLLVKPCCCTSEHEEEHDEIEFTNIRNADNDMQQNLMGEDQIMQKR